MLKRLFDIAISGMLIVILFAPIAFLSLLVRVKLGSPVFFKQVRPGRYAKPFTMVKFRTMTDERDENGQLLPDHIRLTPFGKLLRSTSLDELPELWNVLKGDMSLVGPRPLLMDYVPLYNDFQMKRHDARPGITGLAQVNGRNAISWDDKFAMDVAYVEQQNFVLDIKILVKTAVNVLSRKDIDAGEQETMPRFTGNSKQTNDIIH